MHVHTTSVANFINNYNPACTLILQCNNCNQRYHHHLTVFIIYLYSIYIYTVFIFIQYLYLCTVFNSIKYMNIKIA